MGLIGGMSYESTITYYQLINQKINQAKGGLNSAKITLESINFEEIEKHQRNNERQKAGEILKKCATNLQKCDVDVILICTNTMHKIYTQISQAVDVPVLHIAQATLNSLKRNNISKVGLLGTIYTMKEDFYKDVLIKGGVEVVLTSQKDMEFINSVIFNELCFGEISPTSKREFLRIIEQMGEFKASGVILGCTEIGLLIKQSDTKIPFFDTTLIRIDEVVNLALKMD
ncbi:aspartate/glutamate racemase family protein [Campylobacter geochelonis]|uniref:aspartate/glutamate racemase family protein n=1 Tax=Campylobacter geochelonis TaxID=1780362 RepID=UPI003BF7FAC6